MEPEACHLWPVETVERVPGAGWGLASLSSAASFLPPEHGLTPRPGGNEDLETGFYLPNDANLPVVPH